MPVVTLEQLRSNKTRESLYILIHSKGPYTLTGQSPVVFYAHTIIFSTSVYNVTKFLDEVHRSSCPHTRPSNQIAHSTQEAMRLS